MHPAPRIACLFLLQAAPVIAEPAVAPFPKERWHNAEIESIAVASGALNYSYPTLMAASGHAFRIQVLDYQPWCPSAFASDYGFDAAAALHRHLPGLVRLEPSDPATFVLRIQASLDAGVAVPALGPWWWGVVTGSTGDATAPKWSLVTRGGRKLSNEMPSVAWILGASPSADPAARARAILVQAVELAEVASRPGPREGSSYASGAAAWRAWIALLRLEPAAFDALAPAHREDGGIQECYRRNYHWLADGRQAAAAYCAEISDQASAASRPHLLSAAAAFRDVHGTMSDGGASLPSGSKDWPLSARAAQAEVMSAAAAHDAVAFQALKDALAAW
jgi:hypothetical protein